MRNSIKRNVALWMVFFFLFSITGCGGGGGGGSDSTGTDSASQTADLQEHLASFNLAMDWVVDDLASQIETLDELNTALADDDGSSEKTMEIGLLVEQFDLDSEILLIDVEAMDLAEAGIQKITNPETSLDSALITTIVGVGLVIKGLYSFGKAMKEYSDDMTEARKERDKAADDVVKNVPGALKKFNDAKKEMKDIGTDATQEFATKVTTELVLGPISPTSTTGVILKDAAGNKVQKGLKIISATKECEDGYDSPDCKIGVDETDDADSAVTPDGDVTIVVGGKDMARKIIKEEIPPGSYTEITIDPTPIEEATPQKIADSDNGVIGDDDTPTNPGDDDTTIDPGDDDTTTDPGDDDTTTDPGDDDTTTDPGDDDSGNTDPPVTPVLTLSAAVSSEDANSITYSVAAAVSGVTSSTTVTISVQNASTGSTTQRLNEDGTIIWSVTVLEKDASVTVRRSDTGEQQSLTLTGKSYDGTYVGTISVTEGSDVCVGSGFSVVVSGSTLSSTEGPLTGTLTGNVMSAKAGDWWILSGSINNNVMSGTWYDIEGDCSGTFSVTKQ